MIMEILGINFSFLIVQLISFVLLASWIYFIVFAISDMKRQNLSGKPLALWILILFAFPVLGGLVYWVSVKPSAEK